MPDAGGSSAPGIRLLNGMPCPVNALAQGGIRKREAA
jgi:hypothetical protein